MELAVFAAVMLTVAAISAAALLLAVRMMGRGSVKSDSTVGGDEPAKAPTRTEHGLTHGQKIGKVIDATDALGALLISDGYMPASEWQPLADKITAAVARAGHVTQGNQEPEGTPA